MNISRAKRLTLLVLILTIFHHQKNHATNANSLFVGGIIAAGSYGIGRLYSAYVQSQAERFYQQARAIIAPIAHLPLNSLHPEQRALQRALRQEIMLQHHIHGSAYLILMPTLRNYPLLWYKKTIDYYINRLNFAWMCTFGADDIEHLLADLKAIDHLLVTDYDYIKERRAYEEAVTSF